MEIATAKAEARQGESPPPPPPLKWLHVIQTTAASMATVALLECRNIR